VSKPGILIDAIDNEGNTVGFFFFPYDLQALHLAAIYSKENCAHHLVQNGAALDISNNAGRRWFELTSDQGWVQRVVGDKLALVKQAQQQQQQQQQQVQKAATVRVQRSASAKAPPSTIRGVRS
jgi:hypothetical protein